MDHYSEMALFVAVAEENGLAAAARRMHQSAPTVTRAIAGLEERLGIKLLDRNTRGVKLTDAGARYFNDCKRILKDVEQAEQSAAGSHAKPEGNLHISSPLLFGQDILTPIVLEYLQQYPGVNLKASFMDRFPNLHEEGIDVAMLMGELPDSSLVALKVGAIRRVVVGAPQYFKKRKRPQHPEDLLEHELLTSLADTRSDLWRFNEDKEPLDIHIEPRLHTSTNTSAITAAMAGAGMTRVMSYQVREALSKGELEIVLDKFELSPVPVYLVYREGRRAAARVRSFVDFAVQRLRETPL